MGGLLEPFTDILFGDSDPPPAPDYTGAAEATAEGNIEAARIATAANRPDQYTPWGNSIWTQDPNDPDSWTQNVNLSEPGQQMFDLGMQSDIGMAELGLQSQNQLQDIFASPFSLDSMGEMPNYQDQFSSIYDAMLKRVNTDVGRDREAMASQLIAQGIPRGSEAFNREMEQIDRQLTDARQQSELAATQQVGQRQSQDMENRRQQIAEMLAARQTPLNEYSAFRTGTQVQQPTFGAVPQQTAVPGADYTSAAGMQSNYDIAGYNAEQAQSNAIMSGLFGLGAGGLAGGYF